MSATVGFPPPGSGPLTVRDLEAVPEDGRRYELIDGMLVVSPVQGTLHQAMVVKLSAQLLAACPSDLVVMAAPFAVHDGDDVELQPDVLVGRYADFTAKDLPKPPVLTVEILSPSTALMDLNTKKAVYERLGVPSYWIIDPQQIRLTVYELDADDRYAEVASVAGADSYDAVRPFPVRIVPVDLLGRFAED
ncbi:Uma2 family endonuclease [Gordonia sp. CPCC 205515]|uniref:Uma2 family endonuclease n=1 Tax=Gordonia sp. CPCC 205515 TaxID=3140791 RepID=UPI003AF3356D